jgi:hypothetical protein
MSDLEKLPFLEELAKETSRTSAKGTTDPQQRMIELLEAIDWKMWMLYNMITKGELVVDQKVKTLETATDKKKLEKK